MSSTTQFPLTNATPLPFRFGRVWNLQMETYDGTEVFTIQTNLPPDNVFTPEQLHITFDTTQTIQEGFWYCDISIYNLNPQTLNTLITQGMKVTLGAGYQILGGITTTMDVIFEGTILQPIWTRENGTDTKLTLHCVCGLIEVSNNFIAQTIAGGLSQRQIVARMASTCHFPLNSDDVDPLSTTTVSRASTFFGPPADAFQEIADDNNANLWFSDQALHIRELRQQTDKPTIMYSPNTGLIGTPQQTQDGVEMKMLLDPKITLMTQIQLQQGVVINQLQRNFNTLPTILDQNNVYIVGRVRHYGDSRGNDWYTEITGFVNAASILALASGFGQ
jgi:baseplate hub protein gp41